jgi:membrane protease subunit HflK
MRWYHGALFGLLGLYLLTGVAQVRPGERAVVRRFGRVLPDKPGPGLWVGLPWGMDRVDRIEVDAVREVSVGYEGDPGDGSVLPAGQLATGDNNLVNVHLSLHYKVSPERIEEFAFQAQRVPGVLARLAEAAAAEWVAGRSVDEVLLRGKVALREEVLVRVRERLGPLGLGVEVLDARVSQVAPPDEVREAFDSVARAQTEMATARNRAEQEASTRRRAAEGEAFRIRESALAYAHARVTVARQEAARFLARLAQYREGSKSNPGYLYQLWQEERGKALAKLREQGRIDLLDHYLHGGGLDLYTAPEK